MERRQFDRHPGRGMNIGAGDGAADCGDGVPVGRQVTLGVGGRPRALAQHVKREQIIRVFRFIGRFDGRFYRLPEDELVADDVHGVHYGPADDRLGAACQQPGDQVVRFFRLRIPLEHLAGQHHRPGRRIDQQMVALANMPGPVGIENLVADQAVGGLRVRHPEQRLGEAHERHALVGGQIILLEQQVDAARHTALIADMGHEIPGAGFDPGVLPGRETIDGAQPLDGRFIGRRAIGVQIPEPSGYGWPSPHFSPGSWSARRSG